MGYKLFLDDIRTMTDCITYMHQRIGKQNPIYLERDWVICRNFGCFKTTIEDMGLPDFISFDHDLQSYPTTIAEAEYAAKYNYEEKTGYTCAQWLVDYCITKGLKIPEFAVHSMNPVGAERIFSLLIRAKQELNDREGISST